jgi:hypothetical protein
MEAGLMTDGQFLLWVVIFAGLHRPENVTTSLWSASCTDSTG